MPDLVSGRSFETCSIDGFYALVRLPERITRLDIVAAFDNPLDPALSTLDGMSPSVRSNILRTLHDVAHTSRVELQKPTVAVLLMDDQTEPVANGRPATR